MKSEISYTKRFMSTSQAAEELFFKVDGLLMMFDGFVIAEIGNVDHPTALAIQSYLFDIRDHVKALQEKL
ncbi:MAG TPA: hypothetical protein EYP59_09215 [Thiotrichaceae bacterium]|nr:hypothetical protein [Thiotrichaceae bacterium]